MSDTPETPTLVRVIRDAIRKELLDVRVSLPARVEKFYKSEMKVDVQPLLKKKYNIGDEGLEKDLPIISNVPVQFPSTDDGKSFLYLPVKVLDLGRVEFSDRSIDSFFAGEGDIVLPNDTRHHDLSDGIAFIPGSAMPFKKAISVSDKDNACFKNDEMFIELYPDGRVKIQGGSKELISILSSWMGHVIGGKILTGTAVGVWLFSTAALLTADKSNLDSLKV